MSQTDLNLAEQVQGVLAVVNGGTGSSSIPTFNQNTTGTAAGLSATLGVGYGGTGVTTLTGLAKGNGGSAFTAATAGTDFVAPGGALGTPSSGTLTNCTFPTLNQSTTGSAATLTTPRNINGVSFNGSAAITVNAVDSTAREPAITAGTSSQYYRGDKTMQTLNQDAVPDGTTNKAYTATDKSKLAGISGTNTGDQTTVSGNAGSATVLQTARTINGVSFNGSANIVVVPRIGTTTSTATPSIDCSLYDQYNITALAVAITGFTFTNTFDGCKLLVRITGTAARAITWGSGAQSSGVATLLATTATTKTHMVGLIYDSVKATMVAMAVDATGY